MSKRRIWLVSLVVGAMVATSGMAFASEHEDTRINYGYDEENQILVFNYSSTDGLYDCTLQTTEDPDDEENAEYTVTYAFITDEGLIQVEDLTFENGDPVLFQPTPEEELEEGVAPAGGPAEYGSDEAAACDLQATQVTGPAGQVNHGMFMKALNSLYDGPHRGCVIRHFAQSKLGKGEQQIKASDPEADPEFEPGDSGTVDFTTVVSDCEKNDDDEFDESSNGKGKGKGKGRPDWAGKGRPDSPGKSDSAPGRDR